MNVLTRWGLLKAFFTFSPLFMTVRCLYAVARLFRLGWKLVFILILTLTLFFEIISRFL